MEKERGVSLVELLIVIALSSFIVEGLFSVYLRTKEHHRQHNALQEITEETRFMNQLLNRAIQGAGYLGWSSWDKIPVYDPSQQDLLQKPILILEKNLPENIKKKIKPDTKAIELRQMDFNVVSLAEPVSLNSYEIKIEKGNYWKKENYLLIADKEHAEIIRIKSIQTLLNQQQVIHLYEPLHYLYEKGAYVGYYLDKIYFIGETGKKYQNKSAVYGLYMYSENGMTEEITELISDMNFQWIKAKTLRILVTFTLPYWVNGKVFSRQEEFIVANRE